MIKCALQGFFFIKSLTSTCWWIIYIRYLLRRSCVDPTKTLFYEQYVYVFCTKVA